MRTFVARVFGVHTEERAWRVGSVGERGSDIDHLAIGPGGVFTINAKHHAGAKIWVGGDTFLCRCERTTSS